MHCFRTSILFIIAIFAGIVLSQYVFVYSDVEYGIVSSLLITLLIYIIISIIKFHSDLTRLAESLALIPLYVLLTSSLPWFFIKQDLLLPLVYSLILGLCFWHMYECNIDLNEVGLKEGLKKITLFKYIVFGTIIAIPTSIIEYLILLPVPSSPVFEFKFLIRDVIYMTFFVGLGEELLFRGIIMNDLKRIFGMKSALISQGFLFGIMHMTWRSVPEIGFTFAAGMILGYFYHKTGNLYGPIAMHSMNNVLLVGVLPYLL